jgi:hypothetical protein
MKRLIARMGVSAAKKNPRAALQVVFFLVRHARAITKAVSATRRASKVFDRAAAQPVQRELRASAASLGEAITRVRGVGVLNAVGDKQAAKHLDRALGHASVALGGVRKAKRTHNGRKAIAALVPLLAVVYGASRLKSRD